MFKPVNLLPVENLLTDRTSPDRLAKVLDELAYDYARMFMELSRAEMSPTPYFNEKSAVYLWWLHELRDTFRSCEIK